MDSKQQVVLGIDIGGTNTVFGYVNEEGGIVCESCMLTHGHESADIFFPRLFTEVDKLRATLDSSIEVVGIGVGAPNANYYTGKVEQPPNLKWGQTNVVEILSREYNVPVVITNDANAAAIGEMKFGAAQGMRDFIVITLGTGLGSGVVIGGKMVYGHDGFAGELGHTIVIRDGRDCGCGRNGCLETYASATGIRRTVFELLCERLENSILRNVSFHDMTAKMIHEAALNGDVIAREAFEITGEILGMALADAVAFSSPEAFILFGGLAKAGDMILEPVKKSLEENLLNIYKGKVKVVLSELQGANSAVLGAAALIWSELEEKKIFALTS
jgi:glucokinase